MASWSMPSPEAQAGTMTLVGAYKHGWGEVSMRLHVSRYITLAMFPASNDACCEYVSTTAISKQPRSSSKARRRPWFLLLPTFVDMLLLSPRGEKPRNLTRAAYETALGYFGPSSPLAQQLVLVFVHNTTYHTTDS